MFCPGMSGTQASKKDWAKGGEKECKRKREIIRPNKKPFTTYLVLIFILNRFGFLVGYFGYG